MNASYTVMIENTSLTKFYVTQTLNLIAIQLLVFMKLMTNVLSYRI